jgi:hypothetical protein
MVYPSSFVTFKNDKQSSVFERINYDLNLVMNREWIADSFRKWTNREITTPPWELVKAGALIKTQAIAQIIQSISRTSFTSGNLSSFSLKKTLPGCGATGTLCIIGMELSSEFQVLWLKSSKRNFTEHDLLNSIDSNNNNTILILADDVQDSEFLIRYISKICNSTRKKIALVLIGFETKNATKINPYLQPGPDITQFCAALINCFPENSQAIVAVQDAALESSYFYDRHLYVFCLAATRGTTQPPSEWVKSLFDAMSSHQKVIQISKALAFVSTLCPEPILSAKYFLLELNLKTPSENEFWTLFRVANDKLSCVHPFIAALFLQTCLQKQLSSLRVSDWMTAYNQCIETLKSIIPSKSDEMTNLKFHLLLQRPVSELPFSRLVNKWLTANLEDDWNTGNQFHSEWHYRVTLVVQCLKKFGAKSQKPFCDILIARVYRYAFHKCQPQHRSFFIEQALACTQTAEKE